MRCRCICRRTQNLLFAFTCWMLLSMLACTATAGKVKTNEPVPAQVLYNGLHCFPAPNGWRAAWITSQAEFDRMFEKCRATRMGGIPENTPLIDFSHDAVLAVEMGKQPSAGYGFSNAGVSAYVENNTLGVCLEVNRPASGAFTAQVMTSPCILIRFPNKAFRHIRVQDQDGNFLTGLDLP